MNALPYILLALVVGGLLFWYERRSTLAKCTPLVADWAAKEGVRVIHITYPVFSRGPYAWRASKMQRVFCVTVQRGNNPQPQTAWLRFGHVLWGLRDPVIDVKFETR
jgi:hypothetical protein